MQENKEKKRKQSKKLTFKLKDEAQQNNKKKTVHFMQMNNIDL